MQATIFKVLQALNEVEVKGEKNHDLLLFAMQQLKGVQNQLLAQIQQQKEKEAEQ